ncbi:MAG: 4-(cytidine 5'-diphospho)-2-C-methyl-D-erythritol kinase [Planctomycetaceae bacterium]
MTGAQQFCREGHGFMCGGNFTSVAPQFTLDSPAKLNIFLEVRGKRADGFHELETVMLRTQFCDQLTFRAAASSEIALSLSDATPSGMQSAIPTDDSNLILRAAHALRQLSGTSAGAHIILNKHIPPESGLGGGSSNAAAALIGCRELWKVNISDEQLHAIAATLGSDINFLLSGVPAAVCRGRGELIEPIEVARKLYFVALRPKAGNSTSGVFRRVQISDSPRSSTPLTESLRTGTGDLNALIFNRLVFAAAQLNSSMAAFLKRIPRIVGRPAFMSGSGSTVYVVANCLSDARFTAARLRDTCHVPVWILECG